MKTKFLAIAMMVLLAGSTTVFAARHDKRPDCNTTEGKCKAPDSCNAQRPCPFDNLNLTAEQQTKLQALKEERRAQKIEKKEQEMKDRFEARKQEAAGYLAKVKEILTPEQYVQFLENSFVQKSLQAKKMMKGDFKGKKGEAKKFDGKKFDGKKGQKPDQMKGQKPGRPEKSAEK